MPEGQTPESIRREIEIERERLAASVGNLRHATMAKAPIFAAAAFGTGFFLAGGIGATFRLLFRRGREHRR